MNADDSTESNNKEGIVQLHEENQSKLLTKQFDWENAVTFTFKNQTRLVVIILAHSEMNKYFSLWFFLTLD